MTQPAEQPPSAQTPYDAGRPGESNGHGENDSQAAYATRGRRLVAGVIDLTATYAVALGINILIWGYGRAMHGGKGNIGHQIVIDLIALAIGLLYYAWPHGKWGQTLGKRATRIRLVRADDSGAVGYGQAAWRFIFQTSFFIIADLLGGALAPLALLGLLNFAWILWDPRGQALHDKAARTVIVTTEPPHSYRLNIECQAGPDGSTQRADARFGC